MQSNLQPCKPHDNGLDPSCPDKTCSKTTKHGDARNADELENRSTLGQEQTRSRFISASWICGPALVPAEMHPSGGDLQLTTLLRTEEVPSRGSPPEAMVRRLHGLESVVL